MCDKSVCNCYEFNAYSGTARIGRKAEMLGRTLCDFCSANCKQSVKECGEFVDAGCGSIKQG